MNWQEAIKNIFDIFASQAAGQPMPADQQKEVARLWLRHVERHAQGHFVRKGVPRHEAEDLAQEVILKLFRTRALADVSHPQAYYYRILHNLFTDYLRQLRPGEARQDDARSPASVDGDEDTVGGRYPAQSRDNEDMPGGARFDEPVDPGIGPDSRAEMRRLLASYERQHPLRYQRLALWVAGCSAREIASVEHDMAVDAVSERQAANTTQSVYATLKHFRAGPPWQLERRR